jgi:lambda family phage tail tape measure protein
MTVANLGLAVDSGPVARAAVDLDKLVASSNSADVAVTKLGTSSDKAFMQVSNGAGAISQRLRQAANDAESMAARVNRALNVRADFGGLGRGADIAAYGVELDRLRSKFNPLFATIQSYKAAQTEIRQAHSLGAISVNEMTAALDRERTAALASIAALRSRRDVVATRTGTTGANSFNTANIAAQFQDIGVTSAMGMSPLQIALQQGTQLSAVFEQMRATGQSVGSGLAAAFASVISPLSLITVGAIAATAAAVQYFISAGDGAKTVDEILKRHKENIERLGPAYEQAIEAQKKYVQDSLELANSRAASTGDEALKKRVHDARTALADISAQIFKEQSAGGPENFGGQIPSRFEGARKAIDDFGNSVEAGQPKVRAFQEEIARLEQAGAIPTSVSRELQRMVEVAANSEDSLRGVTKTVDQIALAFSRAQIEIDMINPLGASGRLSDIETRLESLFKKMQAGEANASDLAREVNKLTTLNPDLSAPINEIARLGQAALDAMAKVQGLQNTGTGDRLRGPGRSQNEFDDALSFFLRTDKDLADKLTNKNKEIDRAAKPKVDRDANAYRYLVKNANDRIEQMKLEQDLIGESGVAQDTLRFKMDLIQKATDRGRTLTSTHRAELEKLAETYGKVAEAAAKATLQADLQFEREQMFRSPIDQTIASTLKGAGLPVDFNSYEAGLIRTNEQLKEARSLAGDFASTFIQGIEQGKSVFESLGDAALSVLDRITDKLLNEVLDAMFQVGSAGAGSGGFNLLSLFGLGGGSAFAVTPGAGLFANGGAFSDGIQKFANGGAFSNSIVNTPTLFKFAQGTGMMGEAGPEAIMPLKRDSSGRLGVAAPGGMAANNNQPIQQTNTYNIDARGAQPGVENQIRAALEEYDRRVLPESVRRVQDDPYRRD